MNTVGIVTTYERFPRVEAVILTQVVRGEGKDHSDPVRWVLQVHRQDGEFLAEMDPVINMEKLNGKMRRAEELLRLALETSRGGGTLSTLCERIEDFFDPEPIV